MMTMMNPHTSCMYCRSGHAKMGTAWKVSRWADREWGNESRTGLTHTTDTCVLPPTWLNLSTSACSPAATTKHIITPNPTAHTHRMWAPSTPTYERHTMVIRCSYMCR
jgi:hypothetical protein